MSTVSAPAFSPRLRLLAAAMVLISAICFSGKAILIKLAYRYQIDSVTLLTLRMLFSLPFFVLNAWLGQQRTQHLPATALSWRDGLAIAGLGLAGYYFASLFDFLGLQYVSAGLERLILYLYPTMVLLLGVFWLKKRITRNQYLALGLTYLGILLALLDRSQLQQHTNLWLGSSLIFISALAYSVYMVGSGTYIKRLGSLRYTSYAMITATAAIVLHFLLTRPMTDLWAYPAPVYGLTLIMAIFSTVLPTLLVSEGIRIIGAGNTSIIGSIGPVATIGLGYLFLGEGFGGWQLLGTITVIAGVLWISLKKE